MHGIIYIPFTVSVKECRDKIIKELKEAGYEIKKKLVDRQRSGQAYGRTPKTKIF